MTRNNKFKFRIFAIFTIIVLCIGFTIKEFQNDTFYMIKLGDYIVHNGIDFKDHWCWITKLSYTYPHWLYDVFLYFIYDIFGPLGIYISTIIIFSFLILLIYFINLSFNKNEFMAFLVAIVSVFGLVIFVTARSQLFSYIIFILEVYFIEKLILNGNKRYIVFLMLLSLLLANVHATIWIFYFILFLPFIGEYVAYLLIKKFNINISNRFIIEKISNFKLLIISFILCLFMGLFSPSKICYTYIFRIMMGNSQSYITEHFPLVIINNPLFLGIVLLLFILAFSNSKIKLRELFMIGGLIFMSLCSVRHISLFYIIGFVYISSVCMRFLNDINDNSLNILAQFMVKRKVVYILLFLLVGCFGYVNFSNNVDTNYVDDKKYPVSAVKYIKKNIDLSDFRVYNNYNYGSYMLFKDVPVFIDSRCDLYLKEFNKNDIFLDYVKLNYDNDYKKVFDKYKINHVLVDKNSVLYKMLILDDKFNLIYNDKYFSLFYYDINQ